MQTSIDPAIVLKTKELCQLLLDHPQIQSIRQRVDAFLADDQARAQYDSLMFIGQGLQQRQQMGQNLAEEEIAEFEKNRDSLLRNPVARNFLDAQSEMHGLQDTIGKHVAKTLELGRIPEESDFDSCCNDHGCGCSH